MKENIRTELRIKKQLIEEIIAHKTQGAILRSKVKWYDEGIVKPLGTSKAQMGRSFRRT